MKRVFLLFLTLTLLLAGCGTEFPGADPPETIQTMVPATEPTGMTEPTTAPSTLPFSLQLPAGWYSRSVVSHTTNDVTVSIDGQETFTVTYTDNAPGAKEKDRELTAEGYTYFAEDGEHFFYYKFHREVPEELVECVLSGESPSEYWDEDTCARFDYAHIMLAVFQFLPRDEDCKAGLRYSIFPLENTLIDCWRIAKEENYTNYRLGISFVIPTKMWDECEIRSNGYDVGLFTVDGENCYEMLYFAACPPETQTAYYYEFMEPAVTDGSTLYFVRSCWTSEIHVYMQTYNNCANQHEGIWLDYPGYIRDRYTTEEVQQIIDSFTILETNP